MPIFTSTTTPYSAGNQAMTIKALEKRQADMLAQMAQQSNAITPENTQTPIQGFGHLMNQAADQMALNRAEAKAAAGKQELAGLMSGFDINAPDAMAKIGRMHALDPEAASMFIKQRYESGEKKLDRAAADEQSQMADRRARELQAAQIAATREGQKEANQLQRDLAGEERSLKADLAKAGREHDIALLNMKNAQENGTEAQKIEAQQRLEEAKHKYKLAEIAATPQSPKGGVEADIKNNIIPPDQATAARTPEVKAPEAKTLTELSNDYVNTASNANNVARIQGLLKEGIDFGLAEPARTLANTITGGAAGRMTGVDKATSERTVEYNRLLKELATKEMSQSLTGSTTNFELQHFVKIFSDPQASDKDRRDAADNLARVIDAHRSAQGQQLRRMPGVNVDELDKRVGTPEQRMRAPDAPPGTPAAPKSTGPIQSPDAARVWLEQHPNDPDAEGVRKALGIK